MDIEILQAQISGAIQARTESNLPLVWDRIADQLSRPALEYFLLQLISTHCQADLAWLQPDEANSDCLVEKAATLSSYIDQYITTHLSNTFTMLDQTILPELLEHTTRDLGQVLDYFNTVFLRQDERQFSLRIVPWQEHTRHNKGTNLHLNTKLLELAQTSLINENHQIEFFSHYAKLARV
ncbi:hypothetical protein BDF14DRAFT_1770269 [Spinellus fusiger]|nr:hypothetical protein BDF14DRAFT_1770269 [Spinellus fusiger]